MIKYKHDIILLLFTPGEVFSESETISYKLNNSNIKIYRDFVNLRVLFVFNFTYILNKNV